MSVFQCRPKTSSLGLASSFSAGGLRKATSSQAIAQLSSKSSCPDLLTPGSLEHKASCRLRVTSAPFITRKGNLVGRVRACGNYCQPLGTSKFLMLESTMTSLPRPENSPTDSTEHRRNRDIGEDLLSTVPLLASAISSQHIAKAPPLSFRAPSTAPKMLPLQNELLAPMAVTPVSPQISFSTSTGSEYDYGPLASAQTTSVTAVLQPHRRSPPPENRPVLRVIRSTEEEHVLSVHLPGFAPEMVTVSARKDDKLAVVADLWHAETNCHHEWLVAFPSRDVNVSLTRAQFAADGTLTIHVPRRNANIYFARSRLR